VGRTYLFAILFSALMGTTACKQGGSLTMQSDAPGPSSDNTSMVEGAEFVSAAQTATSSTHLYTIQSSLGDSYNDIVSSSGSGGSTLYSNVQGQMISTQ
jgi:hypothetical protein